MCYLCGMMPSIIDSSAMTAEKNDQASIQSMMPVLERAEAALVQSVWPVFEQTQYGTMERVLEAFARYRVGTEHFSSVTGYGHDDLGRQVTDQVFAHALQAEAALVRSQIVSGTHAIAVALQGCLVPGNRLLSVTGTPYDTLQAVIGTGEAREHPRSLTRMGISYAECSVWKDGVFTTAFDDAQRRLILDATVIFIQRSRGYELRPPLSVSQIAELCRVLKQVNPNVIIMVDNCYGEFVEMTEPTAVGADVMAGSLIKNPGGGIVPTGGYVAGRKDLVQACAEVLTCPGVGEKGGYTFDLTRVILQGLYLAPGMVKETLKGMTLAAHCFEQLGYETAPHWQVLRSDTIQAIRLGSPEKLQQFCAILQSVSPVDSAVTPIPCATPGYEDAVIMSGGTFIQGATSELSSDGPMREPYVVFLQGGLSYAHTRLAVKNLLSVFGDNAG